MTGLRGLPRVGVVGMWHETNTYSPLPTTLADFEDFELLEGRSVLHEHRGIGTVVGGFCDTDELELVPLLVAGAMPSGTIERETIESLLDRLAAALESAGRLDGVLVNLHGAMVAEGNDDVELETIRVVRRTQGDVPVAAVLDLHANPSPALASLCDALISYDTYPHVDMRERGREAAVLLAGMLRGRRLRTWIGKVPLLVCPLAQATDADPMRGLQERAWRRAAEAGVLRACVVGGFAYSDVERAGISVLAVADDGVAAAARQVVEETVADIERQAAAFIVRRPSVAEAVAEAVASQARPVVLADVADNIGGGTPGDGTALLAELLAQRVAGAVVSIVDPEVARRAAVLGPGGRIKTLVGGKTDRRHGEPVPVEGVVQRVTDGRYRAAGTWMTGRAFSMGTTALVDVDGLSLVVMERRLPPFHAEQLTSIGIDPAAASVIVAKGAVAWRSAWGDVAKLIIEVDTPGVTPVDPWSLLRRTAPVRS